MLQSELSRHIHTLVATIGGSLHEMGDPIFARILGIRSEKPEGNLMAAHLTKLIME